MFGMSEWATAATLIGACIVIGTTIFLIIYYITRNRDNADFYINKNGMVIKAHTTEKITPKKFVECMAEIIVYIEKSKEQYVDDVIGIKNRFFKQSKDFANASIESIKNEIIELYKDLYMRKYSGISAIQGPISLEAINPTSAQLEAGYRMDKYTADDIGLNETINEREANLNNSAKKPNPCAPVCSGFCNSGLYYFDSKLTKDFGPIKREVYRIIEENHLINRTDREFEEEIDAVASQLSSELKNKALSYPIPIDNIIVKSVIDKLTPRLKEVIEDALRRSRTLSQAKRNAIYKEQIKYYSDRNGQLSRIVTILGEDDLNKILGTVTELPKVESLPDNVFAGKEHILNQ